MKSVVAGKFDKDIGDAVVAECLDEEVCGELRVFKPFAVNVKDEVPADAEFVEVVFGQSCLKLKGVVPQFF